MEANLKITDEQYIAEWRMLLEMFHKIPFDIPKSTPKYNELKELAKNSKFLTPRQREGIIDRCDNCINGTYGKTKRPEHLAYGNSTPPITKEQSNNK